MTKFIGSHRRLMSAGLAFVAATALAASALPARALDQADPTETPAGRQVGPDRVEVVFVLDTTGSMTDLIEGAKKKIWAIADGVRKSHPNADVRFGLIGYRDRGDLYVTDKTDLSSDIHAIYGKLIQFNASGGGDWPESVNEALNVAVTRMAWTARADTRRIVFLVGDAPPHMDYKQDISYADTLKIAAREGIVVNAVQAGDAPDTAQVWRSIAQLGHGKYIPIAQSGGVVMTETPYDKLIFELQLKLNRTVVPYGAPKRQMEVRSKVELNAKAAPSAASDIASYNQRAAKPAERKVVTGEGDLVADVQAGRVDAAKIAREEWPDELKALPDAERKAAVDKLVGERGQLQSQLGALVEKRDAFQENQRATNANQDGFDEVVQSLIREQVQ